MEVHLQKVVGSDEITSGERLLVQRRIHLDCNGTEF